MCGGGNAKVKNNIVDVYLGAYGASLKLNKEEYCPQDSKGTPSELSREEMALKLSKLTKKDLIEIILQVIDNGSEE